MKPTDQGARWPIYDDRFNAKQRRPEIEERTDH
jgi:hypothetical protein